MTVADTMAWKVTRAPDGESLAGGASAEELALLDRVLAGDREGWTLFCERYERLISGCVARVLRRFGAAATADDRADLVAEVWVQLLGEDRRKLRAFDPARGYRLSSWLMLLTINCTIDRLRARSSHKSRLEALAAEAPLAVTDESPDAQLEAEQAAELARRALAHLPVEDQRFLWLCFCDERPTADVARELGIAVNTVHSRKFKLRKKLEQLVARLERQALGRPSGAGKEGLDGPVDRGHRARLDARTRELRAQRLGLRGVA
ncbi:MAG: sigma-70 family RNA polymerase sigma factor [Deltaproteobacteria bacterium]|nr:sigma-70 family RNA polymerase sigma factor [Deltaproteobacteria bacterium]